MNKERKALSMATVLEALYPNGIPKDSYFEVGKDLAFMEKIIDAGLTIGHPPTPRGPQGQVPVTIEPPPPEVAPPAQKEPREPREKATKPPVFAPAPFGSDARSQWNVSLADFIELDLKKTMRLLDQLRVRPASAADLRQTLGWPQGDLHRHLVRLAKMGVEIHETADPSFKARGFIASRPIYTLGQVPATFKWVRILRSKVYRKA